MVPKVSKEAVSLKLTVLCQAACIDGENVG
jgi:hypothetical protein